MRIEFLVAAAAIMMPIPASAAVMLAGDKASGTSCHLDLPGCGRSMAASAATKDAGTGLPDPAIPALIGVVILGLALGRRRPSLDQVSS